MVFACVAIREPYLQIYRVRMGVTAWVDGWWLDCVTPKSAIRPNVLIGEGVRADSGCSCTHSMLHIGVSFR